MTARKDKPMTAAQLQAWRGRMGYSIDQAADALGHSAASMKAMLYGSRPINKTTQKLAATLQLLHAAGLLETPKG